MKIKDKQKELKKIDRQIAKLQLQIKPLVDKKIQLCDEIRDMQLMALGGLTPQIVASSHFDIFEGSAYKELTSFMNRYKYVRASGYWSDTNTKAIQVSFDKTDFFEPQIEEIMQFIPHIPYSKRKARQGGYSGVEKEYEIRPVDIFEFTLSSGGSYFFGVTKDDELILFITRYSRTEVIKEFSSLEEGLKFVYDKHPYKRTNKEEEEAEEYDVD